METWLVVLLVVRDDERLLGLAPANTCVTGFTQEVICFS